MSLKLPENLNYCATIVEIKNIIPLEGMKTIQHTSIFGNLVIISKDAKVGDIGIFFPPETALSKEFLSNNNLYGHSELNLDKTKKGYFSDNGRVRTVKFQGHKSMGFFIPLDSLAFTNHTEKLKIGDSFDEINGIKICQKYFVFKQNAGQQTNKSKAKQVYRIVDKQWNFHLDTEQLGKNINKIKENDLIQLTVKLHGCVSEETEIETFEYGPLSIKEIVNNKIKCTIKAFDTKKEQIIYVPIDSFYFKANEGDWYELELENGKKIKITGNNPIWLPELSSYKEVQFLAEGDSILFDAYL